MIFISYITLDTPYVDVLNENLLPSLKHHNLAYHIGEYKDLGSWSANTNIKCNFILDCLLKFKESVCFLDADAQILKSPELLLNLPNDFDISFHWFNWMGFWRGQWEDKSKMQLLSGTLAFNYNQKIIDFLNQCIQHISHNSNQWEQISIQQTLESQNKLNIIHLPIEYCTILKQDYSIPSFIKKEDIYILHTQASRKYKYWWRDKNKPSNIKKI